MRKIWSEYKKILIGAIALSLLTVTTSTSSYIVEWFKLPPLNSRSIAEESKNIKKNTRKIEVCNQAVEANKDEIKTKIGKKEIKELEKELKDEFKYVIGVMQGWRNSQIEADNLRIHTKDTLFKIELSQEFINNDLAKLRDGREFRLEIN